MKKKLKLNKKTIAELSNSENIVGGVGTTDLIVEASKKVICVTNPCNNTLDKNCTSIVDACGTRICISDVECGSRDTRCNESDFICIS